MANAQPTEVAGAAMRMDVINIALAQMANARPMEVVGAAMSQEKVDRSPVWLRLRMVVLIHPGFNYG